MDSQLKVDCWFGNETYKATKMFQICSGLKDDGKIGEQTWPALESATPERIPPTKKTPPPKTLRDKVNENNQERKDFLEWAIVLLRSLESSLDLNMDKINKDLFNQLHRNTLDAIKTWLKADISDPDFRNTVTTASVQAVEVNICRGWEPKGEFCRIGVLLHEFNHFIGIHKEAGNVVNTPGDAFDKAHGMAQFVLALNRMPTNCCKGTC